MKEKTKNGKKHYDVIRPVTASKKPVAAPEPEADEAQQSTNKAFRNLAFTRLLGSVAFGRLYAMVAVALLGTTSLLWSFLGARLQAGNADQLVDPYLFQSGHSLQQATFPGAHTFLLKWPLFWLIQLFHDNQNAYVAVTIAVSLLTVGLLAFILYRIERRPAVFGTLCLALASILLLVPAQPYAGGLLPVNMALLATRNLEYVLYIAALAYVIRSRRLRDWRFWAACGLLLLLLASDRLFLGISAAGAFLMLFVYALRQHYKLVTVAARWLLMTILAAAGSLLLLAGLQLLHVTHFSGGGSSPYALTGNLHSLLLGGLYAVLGWLTNFGANPAYDATEVRNIPAYAAHHISSPSGLAYAVNLLLLLAGLWAAGRLLWQSFRIPKRTEKLPDAATGLALTLLFSAVAATGLFIGTNHYYAVDARYLSIALFAIIIAAAAFARRKVWDRKHVVIAGLVIILSIFLAVPSTLNTYNDDRSALTDITERNQTVAQILHNHKVSALVGDYWRVIPIRQAAKQAINVMPLSNCTQQRADLSTTAWNVDLNKDSFAYLLSFDKSLTDFPQCSQAQVTAAFGHPDANVLVTGTFAQPTEELLFYDHGINKQVALADTPLQTLASITPVSLGDLPDMSCPGDPSLMNIVAHEDDDLLFTSPDLQHALAAGDCVRSVYITAGDAGYNQFYWLTRQQGVETAYSSMIKAKLGWQEQVVKLANNAYITIASPRGNTKISLVFMNLPDGNLHGEGFKAYKYQSLLKLRNGQIKVIQTVDHQSVYSAAQLTTDLFKLMETFQPNEIHTQAPENASAVYPDHSDHLMVGRFTHDAFVRYQASLGAGQTVAIKYYIGYPIHGMPPNVTDGDLLAKEAAFFAYATRDGGVCGSSASCVKVPTYDSYLSREYLQTTP